MNSFHFASHKDFVENSHTQYSSQWPGLCSCKASVRKQGLGWLWPPVYRVLSSDVEDKACPLLYFPGCLTAKHRPFPKARTSLLPSPTLFYLLGASTSASRSEMAPLSSGDSTDFVQVAFKVKVWGWGLPQTAQPRTYFHRPPFKLSLFGFRGSI